MGRRAYGVKRNDYNNDDYVDDDVDDNDDDDNNNNNFSFSEVTTNRPRCFVTHTDQSN
jgi:hypothetical protein